MPRLIAERVLAGRSGSEEGRQEAVRDIEAEADRAEGGFDLDAVTENELDELPHGGAALTMDDLESVVREPALLPPGMEAQAMRPREWKFQQPGMTEAVRVATDPGYYEENAESVELWSPGNPTFPLRDGDSIISDAMRLSDVLSRST